MTETKVTVDKFDDEINKLKNQINEINKTQLEPLYNRVTSLKKQKNKYIVENKLYKTFPLDKKYVEKCISNITFITAKGETEEYFDDELFWVDKHGFPYYSSYENGILEYSQSDKKFIHMYHGFPTKKDFIGYIEIDFNGEDLCEF